MVTHAGRNSGLRKRGKTIGLDTSGGAGFDEPNAPSSGTPVQPLAPQSGTFPLPAPTGFGDGYAVVPPAALGNAPLGAAPAAPQDVVLGANRDPARALPAVMQPTLDTANPPLPPSRPSGLGGVLASAVQGNSPVPLPPPRPRAAVAPAAPAAPSPWITADMQNTDPNQRNRPQMGMLDLSKLFGGR